MREDVHPRRVEVAEPGAALLGLALHEVERRREELFVHRFHPLAGERAGVLDGLLADLAEHRIDRRVVLVGRLALHHAARTEFLFELRVLRVVGVLRLLLGVEVIEIAEELVEAVHRRQMLVAVAKVVLAELAGGVAEILEELPDGRVLGLQAERGARHADLREAGADRRLPGDEGGAAGGAALLPVEVGEHRAFLRDAVEVGRAIAHQAVVVAAEIEPADVVGHDEQDVRLVGLRHYLFSPPRLQCSPCAPLTRTVRPGRACSRSRTRQSPAESAP